MNALIKIEQKDGNETVNARELHEFLGVQSKFADWIKNRIEKYGFSENLDFVTASKILEPGNGNRGASTDYFVSLDMAKELSMVENNDKGREARRYFIEVEKKARLVLPALGKMTAGKLPSGPQLKELGAMASNKILTPVQIQKLLGVYEEPREAKKPYSPPEVYDHDSLINEGFDSLKAEISRIANGAAHGASKRLEAKLTQDRMNGKLGFDMDPDLKDFARKLM